MKTHILVSFLTLLFVIPCVNAQGTTNIDDPNFEQALIDLGIDSGAIDGSVLTANIIDVTFLDVSGKNITDLKEIASFTNLESLICSDNNLVTLDVSTNVNLKSLLCSINQLTSLDIRSNSNLESLDCSGNQITELILQEGNVAGNPLLERLTCSNNRLTSIDVSENTNLTFLAISSNFIAGELVVSNNTNLESLFCSSNQITDLDLSINTVLKNLDVSNNLIPTLDLSTINTVVCPDPQTDPVTICQGTGSINVSNNDLTSLILSNGFNDLITSFNSEDNPDLYCIQVDAGFTPNTYWKKDDWTYYSDTVCTNIFTYVPDDNFEAYLETNGLGDDILDNNFVLTSRIEAVGVTTLNIAGEDIKDLTGIQDFVNLDELDCSNNILPSLDLTANTALTILNCSSQIPYVDPDDASNNYTFSSLNINANSNLTNLNCSGNTLSSLDISGNLSLTDLDCSNNGIEVLNVSSHNSLENFYCNDNSLLILNINNGNNPILNNFNATNNPDFLCIQVDDDTNIGGNWFKDGNASYNDEGCGTYVPDDAFEAYLETEGLGDGILNNNYVSTADVSSFTGTINIANLGVSDLTGIEAFVLLTELDCSYNNIASLDLSANGALISVLCNDNNLEFVDLRNTTNNPTLVTFNATNNPNLYCINVDDRDYSMNAAGWDEDINDMYYVDCEVDRYTIILDDNFEQALIDLGIDSGPLDDRVLTANIEYLTSLDVSGKNIDSLEGIEAFLSLTELDCSSNYLEQLNVSDMVNLQDLFCGSNYFLTNNPTNVNGVLNTTGTTSLTKLFCADNDLADLDISLNTNLEVLDCSNNNLEILDISNNDDLVEVSCDNNQIANFTGYTADNFTLTKLSCNNNALETLQVNRCLELVTLNCRSNGLNSLNITANNKLKVLDFSNNELTNINLSGTMELISLSGSQNELTEINDLSSTNIETLILDNNQINQLDLVLNNLTSLKYLVVSHNQLSNLDVSNNEELIELNVSNNQLTDLLLSTNLNQLKTFNCSNNEIARDLDLSSMNNGVCPEQNEENPLDFCPDSITINISNNQLEFVNLQNGFNTDISNFNATANPNLTCIQVDDVNNIGDNWTKDATTEYSIDCRFGETYVPDDNFEQALITLGYDVAPLDDYVPTANIENVTQLDISGNAILDLTGIEDFTDLQNLNCSNNSLSTIDLSSNTQLDEINCSNNTLGALDLTNNTNITTVNIANNTFTAFDVSVIPTLQVFNCDGNAIKELDFTTNTALTNLSCTANALEILNLQNGQNPSLLNLDAQNNPDLSCIQTDDGNAPGSVNWLKDATTEYAINCHFGETYVPDDNFEQALIDLGYDVTPLDDYIPTINIESISSLDVGGNEISDLTGIEDFVSLTNLSFDDNVITTVDLSSNMLLQSINASGNQLTDLDISNQSNLSVLNISKNNFTQIDFSNNLGLIDIDISENVLTNLDVSLLLDLVRLNCSSNQLTALDVTQNNKLNELICTSNLFFDDRLNIQNGANENLSFFSASNNPDLGCILVDNPVTVISNVDGSYDNWFKDATASYQSVCADADNDGVANVDDQCPNTPFGSQVDLFGCPILNLPNNNFTILVTDETCLNVNNGKINISTLDYYNYQATVVGTDFSRVYHFTNDIDILNLLAGTYQLCITIDEWPNYLSCYDIVISHPEGLNVLTSKNLENKELALQMAGSESYNIDFNGLKFTTSDSAMSLKLKNGANSIKVSTDIECQGIYEENIYVSNEVFVYPNPFQEQLNISLGSIIDGEVTVNIYSHLGQIVYSNTFLKLNSNNLSVDTNNLVTGLYSVSIQTKEKFSTFKIIKK